MSKNEKKSTTLQEVKKRFANLVNRVISIDLDTGKPRFEVIKSYLFFIGLHRHTAKFADGFIVATGQDGSLVRQFLQALQ